jgi:hypothetical protein
MGVRGPGNVEEHWNRLSTVQRVRESVRYFKTLSHRVSVYAELKRAEEVEIVA